MGYNEQNIEWDGRIGIIDLADICTKDFIYWIKLDNGKAAQVAEVRITINPFPAINQMHLAKYEYKISTPGLISNEEIKAYGEAVYRAGVMAGECIKNARDIRK